MSRRDLSALMVEQCLAKRRHAETKAKLVFAANGQTLSLAAIDRKFNALHDMADIVHADGQPVVLASRWLTQNPIAERSATTDFLHDAAEAASHHGLRFFLLGGTETVNRECVDAMRRAYPGLEIAGRRHGYFSGEDETQICEDINRTGADVVWIGLGVPLEQEFCARNRDRLCAAWLVTSGGCFNYVTGHYRRAPAWMQAIGLEWLYRFRREPLRLFGRYALTNPHALYLLLTRTRTLSPGGGSGGDGPEVAEAAV